MTRRLQQHRVTLLLYRCVKVGRTTSHFLLTTLRTLTILGFYLLTANAAIAQTTDQPLMLVLETEQSHSAQVGDLIENLHVSVEDILLYEDNAARVQWRIEPANAARLETATTTYFTESSNYTRASTAVTVLQEGTFYIIGTGLYDLPQGDELVQSRNDTPPVLGENEVAFTVTVGATPATTDSTDDVANLSHNQIQSRSGVEAACAAIQSEPDPTLLSNAQMSMLDQCESLALLSDPRVALNRLAADELFAIGDAMIDTGASQLGNIQARIESVRTGQRNQIDIDNLSLTMWGENISSQVLATAASAVSTDSEAQTQSRALNDSDIGFFANGNISVGKVNGDGRQQDGRIRTQGLTLGADYRINQNVIVGTGIGLVKNDTDFSGDNGELQTQGFNLSVFSTWYESDEGHADIILDVGRNTFDLTRQVNLPGQQEEFAIGSTDATLVTLAISAARTLNHRAWTFGPTIRMQMTSATVDAFQERSSLGTNSSGTNLNVRSHSLRSMRMALGFDITRAFNTPRAVLLPLVRAEFELESENDKGDIEATFVHDPGTTPMRFTGTERDDSYLNIVLGTTAVFAKSTSGFLFYEAKLENEYVSQKWLKMGIRLHF